MCCVFIFYWHAVIRLWQKIKISEKSLKEEGERDERDEWKGGGVEGGQGGRSKPIKRRIKDRRKTSESTSTED